MSETVLRPEPDAVGPPVPKPPKRSERRGRVEQVAVAVVVVAVLSVYALRGGSYDVVARGEAGLAVWWTLLLGAALGLLPRRKPRGEAWFVLAALGLMALWTALALRWTESDERTSLELARVLQYAGLLILLVSVLRPSTVGAAVAGASIAATGICVVALASRLWPEAFPVDRVARAFSTTRLNYPLNYWNGVAAWGSMATAMALTWSAHARQPAWRALALASVPVSVTVVYLTYSRAGVAGVALGATAALVLARTRLVMIAHLAVAAAASYFSIHAVRAAKPIADATGSGGRGDVLTALLVGGAVCAAVTVVLRALGADERARLPRRIGRPVFAAVIVVAVIAGAIALGPAVKRGVRQFDSDHSIVVEQRSDPSKRLTSASGNRHNLWTSALDAFRSKPVEGTGPGTFEFWWNRDKVDPEQVRDAHSLYIESLAESGVLGFVSVIALCGGLLFALVRFRLRAHGRSQTGAAAAALAGFGVWLFHAGVDWMWEETAVTVLALVLGAAGLVSRQRRRARPTVGMRIGGVALAVIVIIAQLPALVGTTEVRASDSALVGGDVDAGIRAANRAIQAWPGAASPYAARARAEVAAGRLTAAARDADRARRREPTNWRHPLLAAQIAAQQGDPIKALRAYAAAARLRPLGSAFR